MSSSQNSVTSLSGLSLLAIDTAFDLCSVALITPSLSVLQRSDRLRGHADEVLPMIDHLLRTHNTTISSLDFLAMVNGPGSFTGLRIGTAVTQGLAFGADLPVVCISALAMMARSASKQVGANKTLLTCLHARENEFYFAAYQDDLVNAPVAVQTDTIFTLPKITQYLIDCNLNNNEESQVVLAGSGWHHHLLATAASGSGFGFADTQLDALLLAELAVHAYQAGDAGDAALATPAYLKDDMEYRTV